MNFFPSNTCQEPQRRQTLLRGAQRKRTGANKLEQGQSCLGIGKKKFPREDKPWVRLLQPRLQKIHLWRPSRLHRKRSCATWLSFRGSPALSRGLSRDFQGSLPLCIPPWVCTGLVCLPLRGWANMGGEELTGNLWMFLLWMRGVCDRCRHRHEPMDPHDRGGL